MHRITPFSRTARVVVALLGLAVAAPAWAAAQRTFVASYGNDVNVASNCSLASPCRGFAAAIGVTLAGGEVVILDTAGYGPMTIGKSLKVIGPSGVYGGISVLGAGGGITTGVVIAAGDTDVVTLRGLDVSGVPTVAPYPLYGIDVQNAGAVHIEKSSIGNFTQDASACVNVNSAKPLQVYVNDSFLRECRFGIHAVGTGADDASRINIIVDNTRIEHGLNTVSTGMSAVNLNDAVVASIRNSVLAWGGDGVYLSNSNTAVKHRAHIVDSQISRFGNAAIETAGVAGASVHVHVATSYLSNNGSGLLHGHGQAIFTSTEIVNHNFSLVDCGGGAASVTSLGYSNGNGSNTVVSNSDTGPPWPAGCTGLITPTQFQGK